MRIVRAELRNFRNYGEGACDFDPRINVITGQNAQGKTNLLEAVFYLAGARSFRTGANVGPALVDIEKAVSDLHYRGTDLHDPDDRFVFYSPMSWHPSSKKAMWCERLRLTLGNAGRIQKIRDLLRDPEFNKVRIGEDDRLLESARGELGDDRLDRPCAVVGGFVQYDACDHLVVSFLTAKIISKYPCE